MARKKKKKSSILRTIKRIPNSRWHVLLAVVIIGALILIGGRYFLFASAANPYYVDECGRFHDPSTVWSSCNASRPYSPGQEIVVPVYGNASISDYFTSGRPSQMHVNVTVYQYDSPVTFKNFSCGTAGSCANGTPDSRYSAGSSSMTKCIQVSSSNIGKENVLLMTLRYTMQSGARSGYEQGSYSIRAHPYWKPGACGSNDSQGCSGYVQNGWCGLDFYLAEYGQYQSSGPGPSGPSPDPSPTPNPGPSGPGGGGTGAGEGDGDGGGQGGGGGTGQSPQSSSTTSGGASGSSSGSTAQQQGRQQSPLPTTSTQGKVAEQPQITPSPFYDGKTYESGSDSDAVMGTAVKQWTKAVSAIPWLIALGVIITVVTLVVFRIRKPRY